MNLLTWNCQGAFRRKAERIAHLRPDLAVIQECECPAKLRWGKDVTPPTSYVWHGDNLDKGVGVFSWTGLNLAIDPCHDPSIRHCVPIVATVDDGRVDDGRWTMKKIHLLAIWAMGHRQKEFSYVGQVYRGVNTYWDFIHQRPTVVTGDWNSNALWDRERRVSNHSNVIKKLAEAGMVSLYHEHFDEAHGRESQMTFWLYRDQSKGYHLDYCAVPRAWVPALRSFAVGSYAEWRTASDHSPLIMEFGNALPLLG